MKLSLQGYWFLCEKYDTISVAPGLAELRLSREPSRVLAEPSHVFGAGWTTSIRLDPPIVIRS
jgi:hypothetical protein